MRLCERVSEHCYVCGDVVYHSPASLRSEELSPHFQTSAICLRMEHMTSVTDLVEVVTKMEGQWLKSPRLTTMRYSIVTCSLFVLCIHIVPRVSMDKFYQRNN